MNQVLSSKYDSYTALNVFAKVNDAKISTIKALKDVFVTFDEKLIQVQLLERNARLKTTGITQAKRETRSDLVDAVTTLADLMFAYASKQKDTVLKSKVANKRTEISNCKESEVPSKCNNIIDLATENLTALLEYGVSTEDIDEAKTLLEDFENRKPQTKTAQSQNSGKLRELNELFAELDAIVVEQILKISNKLKKTEPALHQQIIQLSTVRNTQTSSTQIKIGFAKKGKTLMLEGHEVHIKQLEMVGSSIDNSPISFKVPDSGTYKLELLNTEGGVIGTKTVKVSRGRTKTIQW